MIRGAQHERSWDGQGGKASFNGFVLILQHEKAGGLFRRSEDQYRPRVVQQAHRERIRRCPAHEQTWLPGDEPEFHNQELITKN